MIGGARSRGGAVRRVVAGVLGALGGAGLGLPLEQFGVTDPTSPVGLVLVLAGLLLLTPAAGLRRPAARSAVAPRNLAGTVLLGRRSAAAAADSRSVLMSAGEKRYGLQKWRQTSLAVRRRDHEQCFIPDCQKRGTVADHITPATPSMPDHEFYAFSNLRAACPFHNRRRGEALHFLAQAGEAAGIPDVRPGGYRPVRTPYGRPRIR
jgi:hypothetical protein